MSEAARWARYPAGVSPAGAWVGPEGVELVADDEADPGTVLRMQGYVHRQRGACRSLRLRFLPTLNLHLP